MTGLGDAAVMALSFDFFLSSVGAGASDNQRLGYGELVQVKGNGSCGKPSRTAASFQLPGLACFGGAFRNFILPNDCGLEGVTDFLVEATLMVASSSVVAGSGSVRTLM
jgi:hypothetical protein